MSKMAYHDRINRPPVGEVSNDMTIDTAGATTANSFGYEPVGDRIGGSIMRGHVNAEYCAPLPAPYTLENAFTYTFQFEMITENEGKLYFGYFGDPETKPGNSLGIFLGAEGNDFIVRPQIWTGTWRGSQAAQEQVLVGAARLGLHTVSCTYAPTGGANLGTITVVLDGLAPVIKTLPAGFRTDGAIFDRFGMRNNYWHQGTSLEIYFKGITYGTTAGLVTPNLTVDPGWVGIGNVVSYLDPYVEANNDFILRPPLLVPGNRMGKGVAVGGTIVRKIPNGIATHRGFALSDTLSFEDDMHFGGMVCLRRHSVDHSMMCGFYNTSAAGLAHVVGGQNSPNTMGLLLGGNTDVGTNFSPFYSNTLVQTGRTYTAIIYPNGVWYPFSWRYTKSNHQIVVKFNGTTQVLNVNPAHLPGGLAMTHFGWCPLTYSNGGPMEVYWADMYWSHKSN